MLKFMSTQMINSAETDFEQNMFKAMQNCQSLAKRQQISKSVISDDISKLASEI